MFCFLWQTLSQEWVALFICVALTFYSIRLCAAKVPLGQCSREIPLVNQKLNFWQKNQLYYEALWFSTKLLLSLEIAKAEVIMSMIELARPPIWWITYISQAHKINNNKELTILHLQNVSWKECWITEYSVGSGNLISIHFRWIHWLSSPDLNSGTCL